MKSVFQRHYTSIMAEAAQHRVQTAMNEFLTEIDKTKLRPIQKSMYLCNVDCMSDMSASMEEVRCQSWN